VWNNGIVQQPNKSTIPKQVHSNLKNLFEFRNFTSPLILRAANIVECLLNKDDFFYQTIGAVLNKIGEHYRMANLSREDLQKLREKILSGKIILVAGKLVMQCYPILQKVHIEGEVRIFSFLVLTFLSLSHQSRLVSELRKGRHCSF
jgi:hypothetical protein